MIFTYNSEIEKLDVALKRESEREGFVIARNEDSINLAFDLENPKSKSLYPLTFSGKVKEEDKKATIEGKVNVGLYIYAIGILLYALVIARLVFSAFNNQTKNTIIALVALVLSIIITVVMIVKIKQSKRRIISFFENINA